VNNKEGIKGGRMNFILNGIKMHHTITNIPTDGVYLGVCINHFFFYLFLCYFPFPTFTQFSSDYSSFSISFTSLRKLLNPPSCIVGVERKCVGYDFEGGFEDYSLNHRDEDGEEIPNIKDYYEKEEKEEEEDEREE
jgi:hypothetical protein